ncbi:alpha/beta fold hydrolase [Granulicella arctica]|uniref:alpha/beta fold hydrolase n=1 Tax=Granulicella arctica TaxID=940613 RepID=UPI0021E03FD9|nr:alpha/beta hydrolase [Granulicella arctica]
MKLFSALAALALALPASLCAQQPPTGLVHTPQVDLAYWVYGKTSAAVPVMAINGGPGLSHIYMMQNDVWPRLSHDRQVVLYDQRGTGKSTRLGTDAPMGMDAQVADLDAVRDHLHFDKVDLVGDSYGGMLSMAYAAAHPEHVHKLVLSDSPGPSWKEIDHLFPDVFPDILEKLPKPASADAPTEAESQQSLRNHFLMLFYSEQKRDAYLAGAKDLESAPKVGAAVQKATASMDLSSAIAKFNLPTLVLTGRYDMNVAPLTAWKLYKAIPGAKFGVFEKSGHLPSYEEPDKYVQVVGDFLKD